jgi:hypothetical protein
VTECSDNDEFLPRLDQYEQVAALSFPVREWPKSPLQSREWRSFAAAAGATFALAGFADAELHYFSPPSPIRLQLFGEVAGNQTYNLDVDGDGAGDVRFLLAQAVGDDGSVEQTTREARATGAIGGNLVIGSSQYAFNVFSGAAISASRPQTFDARLFQEVRSVTSSDTNTTLEGEWDASSVGILGARFRRGAGPSVSNHFAWIRVKTAFTSPATSLLEILNWAYEDVPGALIRAGDQVGQADLVGDYDGNRVVDNHDFVEWKTSFGLERIPGEAADGNGNGVVDAADYTVWRDQMPISSASGATVPEPTSVTLAALAMGYATIASLRRCFRNASSNAEICNTHGSCVSPTRDGVAPSNGSCVDDHQSLDLP